MCRRDPSTQPSALRRTVGRAHAASCSMSSAARAGGSCSRRPRRELARPRAQARLAPARARTASRTGPRRAQPARHAHADARPVDARGALVHVAGRGHDDHGAAAGQRPRERAVAAVADDDVAARHRARVGEPVDEARVRRARRPARPAAGGSTTASTRTGASARPASVARSSRCDGSCEVDGATSTSGPSPGGSSHLGRTAAPTAAGPTTCVAGSATARGYSSCGNVATRPAPARCRRARGRAGAEPEAPARLVELARARARGPRRSAATSGAPQRAARRGVRGSRAPTE